jgi:hypothetical protein
MRPPLVDDRNIEKRPDSLRQRLGIVSQAAGHREAGGLDVEISRKIECDLPPFVGRAHLEPQSRLIVNGSVYWQAAEVVRDGRIDGRLIEEKEVQRPPIDNDHLAHFGD